MVCAQPQRIPIGPAAAPVPRNKAERRAALIETAVFEPAKLECPRRDQHDGTQDPAIDYQPGRLPHNRMERGIKQMRGDAKGTSDQQIAGDQQQDEAMPVRPCRCQPLEPAQQR